MATVHPITHNFTSDNHIRRQIALWGSQGSIHEIANAMPVGVLVLNAQRQAVFTNEHFRKIANAHTIDEILGKRPGDILLCANAHLEDHGCGSSLFCKNCGAMRAIISSLSGDPGLEESYLERQVGHEPLQLRVKTTPVERDGEQFTIFAIEDISVEKERDVLLQTLKHMSETDELTGLHNRRFLYKEAEKELTRAARYDHPISCFMIDIDHFKQVNDTYGHQIGDKVLVAFAETLQQSLRQIDITARWGGEEFVVLLPEADAEQAQAAAERLRQEIERMRISSKQGEISITVSIGTTGLYASRQLDFDTLIRETDDALYQAKQAGRNCVVNWETP